MTTGITMKLESVDPERAATMLAHNTRNRGLAKTVVNNYARQMSAGTWLVNGDALRFSSTGVLLDGQHRLAAVIESGVTIDVWVGRGFSDESQLTMDAQRKRTAGDHLLLAGIPNGNKLASVARLVHRWDAGERSMYGFGGNTAQLSSVEVLHLVQADEMYAHAVRQSELPNIRATAPARASGALFYLIGRLDHQVADEFVSRINSGEMLAAGDPILTLRNYWARMSALVGRKPGSGVYLNGGIRCWNAHIEGRALAQIAWKEPVLPELTDPRRKHHRRTTA